MKLFIPLIILIILLASCSKKPTTVSNTTTPPPVVEPPVVKPYSLVWSDEFNINGKPDSTKWTYETGGNGWGNNELEYYTDSIGNGRVENGNLVIEARYEKYNGRNYTSARIISKNKAQWTYGKFEIRARIPKGVGTWPAIWLLSSNDPLVWPDNGEIDIMEEVGFDPNVIHGTAHNKMYYGGNGKGGNVVIQNAQDSFHVYSIEWAPHSITWSVDSTAYYTYNDPGLGYNAWPYFQDFFMILNLAIGGNWGGAQGVDNSIFPQQLLIDYVRVYQRK
ncbi:MAG: family 16 glycosylhydrolase [Flavisolibacter sp.]